MSTEISNDQLKQLASAIRILSAEGVQAANSGHPGMPMGTADLAAVLWSKYLRFDPADPDWVARDRFVLSAGHGSMLLYSLLHLFGFSVSMDDLKNFRQLDGITPGHPEFGLTPGVDTTTGPLGQGFANGVGMALSGRMLQDRYDKDLFDYRVFGIVSDGDLMEGISSEAASLAAHLKLGNLVYLYDDNQISIGGGTDICFTESVADRFQAYGWQVQKIDGHDFDEIDNAIKNAVADTEYPSIICARTRIGLGSPNKVGTSGVHGAPLGEEELELARQALGWTEPPFTVPGSVKELCAAVASAGKSAHAGWESGLDVWKSKNKELAARLQIQCERTAPSELKAELVEELSTPVKEATRKTSSRAIQIIAKHLPFFVGGSADLEPSNLTLIKESDDIAPERFSGRNIRFGVREHAMGAMANGLAYGRTWIPFTATFLVFSDYMRPSMRIAALSHLQSLFIFTHDSFWVGEDGPTHQPIEHIESLRIIPNLYVYRPADGLETAYCYLAALDKHDAPAALLFTRQGLPPLDRDDGFDPEMIGRGGYVAYAPAESERTIIATGSEVWLAIEAARVLASEGTPFRVVSMPCQELFFEQSEKYQSEVIPTGSRCVSIEAGVSDRWRGIVGTGGLCIGIDHFGESAPGAVLAEKFGFTVEGVVQRIKGWLQ